jgi:drug/metabolite transporter superfamily protein YnfA
LIGLGPPVAAAGGPDFASLLAFPDWTGQVFALAGLCLLLLGLMAWLSSHRLQRRTWGRRFTLTGGGLFVVGTAWGSFLDLLRYVLG